MLGGARCPPDTAFLSNIRCGHVSRNVSTDNISSTLGLHRPDNAASDPKLTGVTQRKPPPDPI